jgi:hypothetical protein
MRRSNKPSQALNQLVERLAKKYFQKEIQSLKAQALQDKDTIKILKWIEN